jgi:sec-independent protein translocase protein TatB
MFDIAWSELLVIGVIALIVLGPKDLPKALKLFTYWTRKARTMMHDFQGHVHEMVREAELDEVKRELEKAGNPNLSNEMARTIDPSGSVENALKVDAAPPKPAVPPPAAPAASETAAPATPPGEAQTRA